MADVKKNDWFATLLFNPDLSMRELSEMGVTTDNSGLKSKDEYRNVDAVKEAFSDENGKFNDKKFNDFYNGALELYNQYALDEYDKKIPQLYLDSKWDAPREAPILNPTPTFDLKKSSSLDPSAVYYMPSPIDYARYTPKELAEMEEVVDYETGESLGWTPEDKGGLFKGLIRPTIVLASYDEDEFDENGKLIHAAGDLKYNANGKPYAETLGNRDIRNKQLIAYSDTLTREKSNWNKVDFFDSDGFEKSFGSTLAKMAVKTIPFFIPGVNTILGGITAAEQLARVIPVLGKTINGMISGNADNSFGRKMNELEGFWARFDPTVSYKSQENLVTFENFGNLISSISGQLFQQRAVGMLPYLLNGKKDAEGLAKIGRNMSYAYMAMTSSQDNYNVFKEAGASDRVAGFATLASMFAIWKLMQIDYFRDSFFKGTYMDESGLKVPAMNVANQVRDKVGTFIEEGEKAATKAGAARFIDKLTNFYYNTMVSSVAKGGIPARMLAEATEEVMEETTTDLTKAVIAALNDLGINVTEPNKELDFNFTLEDVAARYGMAAFGGFIGGGIFAGQEKFENWLMHKNVGLSEPDDMKKFIYYIAQGKGQEMKDFYKKWHKKGLLGSKDLSTKLTTIESISGTKTVAEPTGDGLSQNDVVYRHLINMIDYFDRLVDVEGLRFTKQQIDNIRTTGFKVTDRTLKAQTLIDLGAYSTLEDDLWNLASEIVLKNNEIQAKLDEITPTGDTALAKESVDDKIKHDVEINRLKDELKELRKKREDLLNGKLNYKYATQSLFIANPGLSDKFVDLSKENFARFKYGIPFNTMSDEQKAEVEKAYEDYKKGEGREKILKAADLYYELSSRWGPRIKEEADKLVGLKIDSLHGNQNLGVIEYVKLLNDASKLEKEITDLRSKESLTQEDQILLNDKLKELIALNARVQAFQAAPGRLLAAAHLDDSEFKALNELLISTEFGDDQIAKVADTLKKMYTKVANEKIALSGDSELQALYNEIRKRYNVIPTNKRMQSYFDNVAEASSQQEMRDTGEDEGVYWDREMSRVNTDNDEWFTVYANDDSILKSDVLSYLNSFIDNFGTNNTIAIGAYNNLLNALKTRTNLSEEEILAFLDYVIPKIKGKSIVDFMQSIDAIRANVKYSPINALLQDFWFDYSGTKSNVIELLESEEKALSQSALLTDYIIQNQQVKSDLQDANTILDVLTALLIGATDKTNESINSFESNPKPLLVLDRDPAVILGNDIDIVKNRIDYLLKRDEANRNQTLKQHELIDKNMRSKFLLAITSDPFVSQFEKIFKYKVGDVDKPINLKEILNDVVPQNFSFDSINIMDQNVLQQIWTKFEQKVYEEVSKVDFYKNDKLFASNLLSLFSPEIWKMISTRLSDKEDEIIHPVDMLLYLMTITTVPSNAFYTTYKNVTTSDDFKFAPVFGQEFAVRTATAMMARKSLFNMTLNQIMENANSIFDSMPDQKDKVYLKNLSRLNNFFMVPGGAGTGKTTGIAGTIAAMFKDNASKQFIALAPKRVQAKRVADELGSDTTFLTKEDFMKGIRGGEEPSEYSEDARIGHTVRKAPRTYVNSIFDKTKDVKVLVIDEVGLFTEAELKEISNWAVENDIFVLGLGDPKQNTAIAHVKKHISLSSEGKLEITDQDIHQESGLEDCVYFKSPMLTASLRSASLAKKLNFESLDSVLYDIWTKYSDNRQWRRFDLDKLVPSDIKLEYYEGQNKFYGEKLVDDSSDLLTLARKLANNGSVAIIYDDEGQTKYSGLTEQGIKFLPFSEMQGDEYDYVLVDVDFLKHGSGAYATLKNLYTITQRSALGSIVKKDHLGATLSFTPQASNPTVNQLIGANPDQIKRFKEYRSKALENVPEDNTFYTFFKANTNPVPLRASTPTPTGPVSQPTVGPVPPQVPISGNTSLSEHVLSAKGMTDWLRSQDFRDYTRDNNNSLYNVAKRIDPNVDFRASGNPKLYARLVETIGSLVRTHHGSIYPTHPLAVELEQALGYATSSTLLDILSGDPELYIVPFNNDVNLLVARYSGNGEMIEIPILPVKTKLVGKYNGEIKRVAELKLGKKGEMIPMSVFLANNPGVYVFTTQGVVSYDPLNTEEIAEDDTLHKGSKKFLLATNDNGKTNNGKVMVAMTDELGEFYEFDDNIWEHPDDGNLVSHYNYICLMGIHKPLQISEVAAYVKAIQQGKSGEPLSGEALMQQGIWESLGNPVEVLKSLDWASLPESNTSDFFSEIYKRKWQVVPIDRANILSKILLQTAESNPKFNSILFDLTLFLNTIVEPSEKVKSEKHVLILTGTNGRSVYITQSIVNGVMKGYNVFDYNPETRRIGQNLLTKLETSGLIPVREWASRLLDSDLKEVQLMRAIVRPDDSSELVDITPNDQLFILLDSVSRNPNLLSELNSELLKNQEFCNSIYMDDSAGNDPIPGSIYFKEFKGDYMNGYVTPVQQMQYSHYKLDLSKVVGVNPNSNPAPAPNVNPNPNPSEGSASSETEENVPQTSIEELIQFVKDFTAYLNSISNYNMGAGSDETIIKYITNHNSDKESLEQFIVSAFNRDLGSKVNSKQMFGRILKNDDGTYYFEGKRDIQRWLESRIVVEGETVSVLEDFTENPWKSVIFLVTLPNGNTDVRIWSEDLGFSHFDSYSTFKDVLDLYNTNKEFFSPISDYIGSLLSGKGASKAAMEWLIGTKEAEEMYMLINKHLMDRLSKLDC